MPSTRVLTADLRWVAAGELAVGDEIIGFDDERPADGQRRRFKFGTITKAGRRTLPVYRLLLSDGRRLEATGNHRWIAAVSGKTEFDWVSTEDIVRRIEAGLVPTSLICLMPVQEPEDSYRAGFLSAAFDGEGYFGGLTNGGVRIAFSQRENAMMASVRSMLDDAGFAHSSRPASSPNVTDLRLVGGTPALLRFMQATRPPRLLTKWRDGNLVEQLTLRRLNGLPSPTVVGYEFIGEQEVAALTSSTGTYIAEGFGSHNTDGISPSNRKVLSTAFVRGELYDTAQEMFTAAAHENTRQFLHLVRGTEGKWDWLLEGHHLFDYSINRTLRTTDQDIADALGCPNLGRGIGVIQYRFAGAVRPLTVWSRHGEGSGDTFAAPLNSVEKQMRAFNADIYLLAHHHKLVAGVATKLEEAPEHETMLKATNVRLVGCGSWLRGFMKDKVSYAEQGMMVPLATGAPIVRIKQVKNDYRVRVEV